MHRARSHPRSSRTTTSTAALALTIAALVLTADTLPATHAKKCSSSSKKHVQSCLKDVYAQEEALPNGPCYSEDWQCVCIMQQALINCWTDNNCPSDDLDELKSWNANNCAGQHWQSNEAGGDKLKGDLALVKTASGAKPTSTSKKDHKKHKHHHHSGSKSDKTSSSASSPTLTAPPSQSTASGSKGGYLYDGPSSASPGFYATPAVSSGAAAPSLFTTASSSSIKAVAAAVLLGTALGGAGLLLV